MISYKFIILIGLLLTGSCLTTETTDSSNMNQCGSPLLGSNQPKVYGDCVLDRNMSDKSCCYVKVTALGVPKSMCVAIDMSVATTSDINSVYKTMMADTSSTLDDINCGDPNSRAGQVLNNCGVPALAGNRPTTATNCTLDTSIASNSCCYLSVQMSSVGLTIDACMKYPTTTIQSLKSSNKNLESALTTLLEQYGQTGVKVSKVDCGSSFLSLSLLIFGLLFSTILL
jgi:hypothetical protein